jgi:EmrB/QacA subfamily drug resistance transporter
MERRVVLLIATLTSFMTPFMASSITIALPAIATEFSIDAVLLAWVVSSFVLPAAVLLLPFGRLADISGRKRVYGWGTGLYTVTSLLCGLAPSTTSLIAFRVLQGIGAAMIFATGMAILTSVFPASQRGRVLGLNVAAVYLGLSLGPSLGGLMTHHLGWRSLFVGSASLGVVIVGLLLRYLHGEWAEARGERFDLVGTLIYSGALTCAMYGVSQLPAALGGWLVLAGLLGLLLFVAWELRVAHPVLEVRLFTGNAVFAFSNLAALVNYSATFAVTFLLSLYLQYIKGMSPQAAGFVLMAQPLVMSIFSPLAGRLSDRVEPRTLASTGMAFSVVTLCLLIFLDSQSGVAFIIACLLVNGFGFALFSSPNTNAVMSSVDRRMYGVAAATVSTMRMTGQMLSMGIATLLFAVNLGRVQISPAHFPMFLKSVHVAFIIFAAMSFGGIFASLARGKLR